MKKKRFIAILTACFMVMTTTAFGAEENRQVELDSLKVQSQAETLLRKAKAQGDKLPQGTRLFNESGVEYEVDVYAIDTSDITTYAAENGLSSTTYIASTDDMRLISGDIKGDVSMYGEFPGDYWAANDSVKFIATLYYNTGTHSGTGKTTYLLKSVSGKYDVKGTDVSVSKQKILYGCESPGEGVIQHLSTAKQPTGTSFTYNTGYTKYIQNIPGAVMGMSWSSQIVKGTVIWTFEGTHNLFDPT